MNLTGTKVQNLVACDLYITNDTTTDYFINPPTAWDEGTTQMWAQFNGDLNAGNIAEAIQYLLSMLKQIKIKRRRVGTQEWTTIRTYNINNDKTNLEFVFKDNTAVNGVEYEYAWCPILFNGSESDYIVTNVLSKFHGTFIGDTDSMYKFLADVEFGSTERHQNIGVFEPIGRKYPIYVSNAETNYDTGSFKGKIVGDYLDTGIMDRQQLHILANSILNFLTNKRAKILKDSGSNTAWLVMITDNPSIDYVNEIARGLRDVNFKWIEIANVEDLESVGMVVEK